MATVNPSTPPHTTQATDEITEVVAPASPAATTTVVDQTAPPAASAPLAPAPTATKKYLPLLAAIFAQLTTALMGITSKITLAYGIKSEVLLTFRQLFGAAILIPAAVVFEWNSRPPLTWRILLKLFLCSIGNVVALGFSWAGLQYTTVTVSTALANTIPVLTFALSLLFRMDPLNIKEWSFGLKIAATGLSVLGALVISLYHGPTLKVPHSPLHWKHTNILRNGSSPQPSIIGPILVLGSCLARAASLIIQGKIGEVYPAPVSSSALSTLMSSVQFGIYALIKNRDQHEWKLLPPICFYFTLYAGVVGTGLNVFLDFWVVSKMGPLYVAVFDSLLLIFVTLMGWGILRDQLYTGALIGSMFIISGLFLMVWTRNREEEQRRRRAQENNNNNVPSEAA